MFLHKILCCVFVIYLFIVGSLQNVVTNKSDSVFPGTPASIQEYPFMVSIQREGTNLPCTGTIISAYWTLTAAICMFDFDCNQLPASNITIYSDSAELFKGVKHAATKVVPYYGFICTEEVIFKHNIGLIKFTGAMPSNKWTKLMLSNYPTPYTLDTLEWEVAENGVVSSTLLTHPFHMGVCEKYDNDGFRVCSTQCPPNEPHNSGAALIDLLDSRLQYAVLGGIRDYGNSSYRVYYCTKKYGPWILNTIKT